MATWHQQPLNLVGVAALAEIFLYLMTALNLPWWGTAIVLLVMWALAATVAIRSPWTVEWHWSLKGLLCVCAALFVWMLGSKTLLTQYDQAPTNTSVLPPTTFQTTRMTYSSRQILQISNVPGNYNQTLNLDNVATLRVSAPFNSHVVTLLWPTSPPITVIQPKAGEKYRVPSSDQTFRFGGMTARGLTLVGPAQRITFDDTHGVHLIRVGERIFRVSLEDRRDKTTQGQIFSFEYEFAISEVEPTAENLAAAVTQGNPNSADIELWVRGYPDYVQKLLIAMRDQTIGTIELDIPSLVAGRPNIMELSAGTKSFLFDPTAHLVRFHMVTDAGRSVDLHLPFGSPEPDGNYFVAFAWDNSKGARLHLNDKVSADGV
jgi:hypothetical protein